MAGPRRPSEDSGLSVYKPMILAIAASLAVVVFLVIMVMPGRGQDIDANRPNATAINAPELAIETDEAPPEPEVMNNSGRTINRIDEPLILEPTPTPPMIVENTSEAEETAIATDTAIGFTAAPRVIRTLMVATATPPGFPTPPVESSPTQAIATDTRVVPPPVPTSTPLPKRPDPTVTERQRDTPVPTATLTATSEPTPAPPSPTTELERTAPATVVPTATGTPDGPAPTASPTAKTTTTSTPSSESLTPSPSPSPTGSPLPDMTPQVTATGAPTETVESDPTVTRTPKSRARTPTRTPSPRAESSATATVVDPTGTPDT